MRFSFSETTSRLGGATSYAGSSPPVEEPGSSPIVELRQYSLHPGGRDVLIDLFDSRFIEPQEEAGITVIGQFRNLDDPDAFVWLRGFRDMPGRPQSLARFYDGPVWRAHCEEANSTMIDSDDVLLLRPARRDSAFRLDGERLPQSAAGSSPHGFVAGTIMQLEAAAEETAILSFFEQAIAPTVRESGASILAYFVTERSDNNFPRLPVRENDNVFVWFAGCPDRAALERVLGEDTEARRTTAQAPALTRPPEMLRLAPTSRSLLHGRTRACKALNP